MLTCSDKEDAGAEEDVVGLVVNSAHPDAEPTQHQQAGAEDGEHAGGTDYTYTYIIDSSELLEKMDFVLKEINHWHIKGQTNSGWFSLHTPHHPAEPILALHLFSNPFLKSFIIFYVFPAMLWQSYANQLLYVAGVSTIPLHSNESLSHFIKERWDY